MGSPYNEKVSDLLVRVIKIDTIQILSVVILCIGYVWSETLIQKYIS